LHKILALLSKEFIRDLRKNPRASQSLGPRRSR
jgi:hypothetical protein